MGAATHDIEAVRQALSRGANPSGSFADLGTAPLVRAARGASGNEIVKLLIQSGADPSVLSDDSLKKYGISRKDITGGAKQLLSRNVVESKVPYGTLTAAQFAAKLLREYPELEELVVEDLPGRVYLRKIKVRSPYRGRNIGDTVVLKLREYARRRGLPLVFTRGNAVSEELEQEKSLAQLKVGDYLKRNPNGPRDSGWVEGELYQILEIEHDFVNLLLRTVNRSQDGSYVPGEAYTDGYLVKANRDDVVAAAKDALKVKECVGEKSGPASTQSESLEPLKVGDYLTRNPNGPSDSQWPEGTVYQISRITYYRSDPHYHLHSLNTNEGACMAGGKAYTKGYLVKVDKSTMVSAAKRLLKT